MRVQTKFVSKKTKIFTSQLFNGLILYGLLVGYCDVLIKWTRHPFNAEDPLASKLCKAKFLQIQTFKKHAHLHLGWPEGE